jgi:hypothetical protein
VYVNGSYEPWPTHFFAIGDNGGGDEWCIDLNDAAGRVWQYDHERGEFAVEKPSIQVHIEDLRKGLVAVREELFRQRKITTEAEWVACTDPKPMLEFLKGRASERKLRLFGCACVRRIWGHLTNEHSKRSVELAERFADGQATGEELAAARANACQAALTIADYAASYTAFADASDSADAYNASAGVMAYAAAPDNARGRKAECAAQADLCRDIFGNPFQTVAVDPVILIWQNGTVQRLAQDLSEKGEFDGLPILGDALEDAGCLNTALLSHCRQKAEHVRGCWLLDLLTAK